MSFLDIEERPVIARFWGASSERIRKALEASNIDVDQVRWIVENAALEVYNGEEGIVALVAAFEAIGRNDLAIRAAAREFHCEWVTRQSRLPGQEG